MNRNEIHLGNTCFLNRRFNWIYINTLILENSIKYDIESIDKPSIYKEWKELNGSSV